MVLSLYGRLIAVFSLICLQGEGKNSAMDLHPLYISVTEINHNAKNQTIEISCKIFADDLEKVLTKSSNTKVDFSSDNRKINNDKLLAAYITRHLKLEIDNKPVSLQFIGSEKEEDVIWSYFQVSNIATVKKLEIVNDILYDAFDTETNLVHVQLNGNRQSKKVTNPESHLVFEP
ncbi:MAG: hypothetical protein JST75_10855 [Bacteroidetes bacterium]|nr:hypothetical protein [Bacteroidota bacterium]